MLINFSSIKLLIMNSFLNYDGHTDSNLDDIESQIQENDKKFSEAESYESLIFIKHSALSAQSQLLLNLAYFSQMKNAFKSIRSSSALTESTKISIDESLRVFKDKITKYSSSISSTLGSVENMECTYDDFNSLVKTASVSICNQSPSNLLS